MQSITVTPETLEAQASKVDGKAADYYNDYIKLLNEVRDMTATDWKGEDANAFKAKVEGFEPDFSKMKKLMDEYADYLRQAARNYRDTQANVQSSISALR